MVSEPTYMIRRFYADDSDPRHGTVIKRGLTLADAQAHCQDPNTRHVDLKTRRTVWFDGYEREA